MHTDIDVHGHRGARGLFPENTLEGFRGALDMGVSTLEMNLCMTKDGIVVVSHEPWMNHNICLTPSGEKIPKDQAMNLNLYTMSYAAIKNYDCGSIGHPDFPQQNKMTTYKPTLREVILDADNYADQLGIKKPKYNLEIKRVKGYDEVYHPNYDFFAQSVMHIINELGIGSRSIVQCFDVQVLEYLHERFPGQTLSYLIQDEKDVQVALQKLSFTPNMYGPHFSLLDAEQVKILRDKNIEILPWTVNEEKDLKRMISLGVDGIITDYPDRLMKLM